MQQFLIKKFSTLFFLLFFCLHKNAPIKCLTSMGALQSSFYGGSADKPAFYCYK